MIAIIASMDEELEFFKNNLSDAETKEDSLFTYTLGSYANKDFVLVKCMTGKVNMAIVAQRIIDTFDIELLINIGVAGGIGDEIEIGEVVVLTKAVQHDMNAVDLGYELGEVPDINIKEFFTSDDFIKASRNVDDDLLDYPVRFGLGLSGDILVADEDLSYQLKETFGGECVDMESAALGQVAYINKIPYGAIRGISDNSDEDAAKNFRKNLETASYNACDFLLKVIENM